MAVCNVMITSSDHDEQVLSPAASSDNTNCKSAHHHIVIRTS